MFRKTVKNLLPIVNEGRIAYASANKHVMKTDGKLDSQHSTAVAMHMARPKKIGVNTTFEQASGPVYKHRPGKTTVVFPTMFATETTRNSVTGQPEVTRTGLATPSFSGNNGAGLPDHLQSTGWHDK